MSPVCGSWCSWTWFPLCSYGYSPGSSLRIFQAKIGGNRQCPAWELSQDDHVGERSPCDGPQAAGGWCCFFVSGLYHFLQAWSHIHREDVPCPGLMLFSGDGEEGRTAHIFLSHPLRMLSTRGFLPGTFAHIWSRPTSATHCHARRNTC